jgi:hypothetical protein
VKLILKKVETRKKRGKKTGKDFEMLMFMVKMRIKMR